MSAMKTVYDRDLRENRLRLRLDEVDEQRLRLKKENWYLRRQIERKNLKIAAMSREIRHLADELSAARARCEW